MCAASREPPPVRGESERETEQNLFLLAQTEAPHTHVHTWTQRAPWPYQTWLGGRRV